MFCKNKDGELIGGGKEKATRWIEYFEELLNKKDKESTKGLVKSTETYEMCESIIIDPPTKEELRKIIRELKNNKSPGENGVKPEMLKYGGEALDNEIHELIKGIWMEERKPENWARAVLSPIYKKEDKTLCENYRGIALLDTTYKILGTKEKIKRLYREDNRQMFFWLKFRKL